MISRIWFVRVALYLVVPAAVAFVALPALAYTEIDSGPFDWESSFDGSFTDPDVAGGTFTASEDPLTSFTLNLGVDNGIQDNWLKAIVMATDVFGAPTGTPLWESGGFQALGARNEYEFTPGLPLSADEVYFIGVDSGVYTLDTYGDFTIQGTAEGFDGGSFWSSRDFAAFQEIAASDVTTLIKLGTPIASPEPGTAVLMGLGLTVLGLRRRSGAR